MDGAKLGFTFDMEGVDRGALLEDAARQMDVLRGHLSGDGTLAESAEGQRTRTIKGDQARLPAANPDIYKISDRDFLARGLAAPLPFTLLAKNFNFYWIHIPVGLQPELNWAFNMVEVRIEFNKGDAPDRLPKAYQILPAKQFQTLMQANTGLEVRLSENLEFEAASGPLEIKAGVASAKAAADVSAIAKLGAGAVLGPFTYRIKKAKIDHNATGMEWVFWRIDGAEFFQEDPLKLVVIAQVPKQTVELRVDAVLEAYRYFNYAAADWKAAVMRLPEHVKSFFQSGAPLRDQKVWNLTGSL